MREVSQAFQDNIGLVPQMCLYLSFDTFMKSIQSHLLFSILKVLNVSVQ
jgi:hypothetical protein